MVSQEVLTALESLHNELEKIEPAIKHVEMTLEVTKVVKEIPQKHIDLLQEVSKNDLKQKNELKALFSKELLNLTDENNKLQKTTAAIQQQVKIEHEALSILKDKVQYFHDRVERINFPERLDKLDANVSGIMAAIQSIQSRLDSLERNISDRLRDLYDYQKESRQSFKSDLEQLKNALHLALDSSSKKQQTNAYITWALTAFGLIIIITILLMKL